MGSTPAYIFDIDGTLANLSHRLHFIERVPKDWAMFFDIDTVLKDKPFAHICRLAKALYKADATIVFVSGRPERIRLPTIKWLYYHVTGDPSTRATQLYMRPDMLPDGKPDHREDYVVKRELLKRVVWDGFTPIMAFDDRDQVVKMWREEGIPCAQVADGNF